MNGLYAGTVTHKRLRPVRHELRYDVVSLLVDVDDLAERNVPALLGCNRWGLMSVHDADHGDLGSGRSIRDFTWSKVREQRLEAEVSHIQMLCYPRILGYAFNPLTVYFCRDDRGRTRLTIYEVHNTFGGRHIYLARTEGDGPNHAVAEKVFPVSPFNAVEGSYGLTASEPGENVAIGVSLTTAEGPLLKAYFRGTRRPLDNLGILSTVLRVPFQSLKVVGGIHWEALKLWLKGLNLQKP